MTPDDIRKKRERIRADASAAYRKSVDDLNRATDADLAVGADAYTEATVSASYIETLRRQRDSAERERDELRKALEPIVASYLRDADPIGDSDLYNEQPRSVRLTLGDLRSARSALTQGQDR